MLIKTPALPKALKNSRNVTENQVQVA